MIKRGECRSSLRVLIAVLVLFFALTPLLFAEITVQNATGTIAITTPTGEVLTIEPGQAIPAIASGSSIEVISGTANIAASGADTVKVLINGSIVTLTDGAQIGVAISASGDATFDVISGTVTVQNSDGSTESMEAGESGQAEAEQPASSDSVEVPGENPVDDPQGYAS